MPQHSKQLSRRPVNSRHPLSANNPIIRVPNRIADALMGPKQFPRFGILRDWQQHLKRLLAEEPGFACLKMDDQQFSNDELREIYANLTRSMGSLNDRYGEFFEVKDRGLDHKKEAIPVSKTRASTGFHTDSSAANYCPTIVGLLCLQPALSGGESLLADATQLHEWLSKHHPTALNALTRPVCRDVITPGGQRNCDAIRKNAFPIFKSTITGLQFRYMRYWIETAYHKLGEPLPSGLRSAMNLIDSYLLNPKNTYTRMLARGEILLVNNQRMCHSRTAFIDSTNPTRKRILVRTWIDQFQPPGNESSAPAQTQADERSPSSTPAFDPALAS